MNLSDLVRDAALEFAEDPALLFQGRPVTFSRLDELVDLAAAALDEIAVERGDRVGILLGNVPEFAYALYGTVRAGAIACPLNLTLTPDELAFVLVDAGAKVVISGLQQLPGLLSVRDRLPGVATIVVVGGPPAPRRTVSWEELLASAGDPPEAKTEPEDPAVLAYTSGTTADPRGAVLSHANLLANLDQVQSVPALRLSASDVSLIALPLFHVFAMNVALGSTLRSGAAAVLTETEEPRTVAAAAARYRATVLFGASPLFAAWLSSAQEVGNSFASVRSAVSGPVPVPGRVVAGFAERFGMTVWDAYALAEAGGVATSTAVGDVAKPGSIGLPPPGVELRLADDGGEEVEDGDPGEILLRGSNVFSGYWNNPELTSTIFDAGWLRTGDVAYRDEDGYLFLVDRRTDVVMVSGFHVYPAEVEEAIQGHPDVSEAAVVGVADDRTGEALRAWVVPEPGRSVSQEEILAFLDGYLARFKWPRTIEVIDELPRSASGRASRRALRRSP